MSASIILVFLSVALFLLFIFLLFFYLRKDQALTQTKAQYENLRRIENERVRINEQRDDYVAMMVHELRSPLSVIKGSADLVIKEEAALSADQKYTLLSQIFESASDLLAIVNDILDVSKIESGRFEIKKTQGSLNRVLKGEVDYYTALAHEHELNFESALDDKIPEFKFDEDRLKHVLNNLLSNAIKFTPKGGKIIVSSFLTNDSTALVSVSDTGKGVPDFMKNKLFNKFVQMENRMSSDEKGTGLGLVIAKGIVEAHGGQIWVEDNTPQGAKFMFTVPFENGS